MAMSTYNYHHLIRDVREGKYTSIGSYPVFFLAVDGACICPDCAKANIGLVGRATRDQDRSGWHVVGADVNWEDPDMFCDSCQERIESAYAEKGA